MPELPEVETIARGLKPLVQGLCIDRVQLLSPGCVQGDAQDFAHRLPGLTFQDVSRRGKLLLFELNLDMYLVSHLKMTGRFLYFPAGQGECDTHTRCIFHLSQGSTLVFKDQRKFGYLRLMHRQELSSWSFYAGLGPEPLDMTAEDFVHRLQGKRAAIKSLLLNQTCMAGIGNIYADESLYQAGIHPQTPAGNVPADKLRALHSSLHSVLNRALQAGGSSFRDYVDGLGQPGTYQDTFMVYGRSGHNCRQCGCRLEKTKVAGRTSVYCPGCQPEKLEE